MGVSEISTEPKTMTHAQIQAAAKAFAVILETSGGSIDDLHEYLSGTLYDDEEFSMICEHLDEQITCECAKLRAELVAIDEALWPCGKPANYEPNRAVRIRALMQLGPQALSGEEAKKLVQEVGV